LYEKDDEYLNLVLPEINFEKINLNEKNIAITEKKD